MNVVPSNARTAGAARAMAQLPLQASVQAPSGAMGAKMPFHSCQQETCKTSI